MLLILLVILCVKFKCVNFIMWSYDKLLLFTLTFIKYDDNLY